MICSLLPGEEDSGARVRKMLNGNLVIENVNINDAGVYKCTVSNEFGTAATTGNLTVLGTVSYRNVAVRNR